MALPTTTIDKYLKYYAEPDVTDLSLSRNYDQVLIIPAFDERWQDIQKVWDAIQSNFLCIIVVNSASTHPATQQLLQTCLSSGRVLAEGRNWHHIQGQPDLLVFNRCSDSFFISGKEGVGLARKIGTDAALKLFRLGKIVSQQLCITDADAQLPADYFQHSLTKADAGLLHAYCHQPPADASLEYQQAMHLYELYLCYYVRGLQHANSPYAFHSLGSTIIVNPLSYAQVRGFPKRAAAEDFYLLNKLRKTGSIRQLNGTAIMLSGRPSTRVPIGTGQGIVKLLRDPDALNTETFYNPAIFELLKTFLTALDASWQHGLERSNLDQSLLHYAQQQALESKISKLRKQCGNVETFRKAAFQWFDGFKTLKLIHYLRDQGLSDVSPASLASVAWLIEPETDRNRERDLLKKLGILPSQVTDP